MGYKADCISFTEGSLIQKQGWQFQQWSNVIGIITGFFTWVLQNLQRKYCVKSVRIWSFSGPYFPAFELNMERYRVSLRIKSKYRKIRTRKTSNTGTFHIVKVKKSKYFKVIHSKRLNREKTSDFAEDVNITHPNYSFLPKNRSRLQFCAQLMSDVRHVSQQNILSRHRWSFPDVLSVFLFVLFYSSYCNIFNSAEIYTIDE